ncbi:hypothetical protein XA68_16434 [Ophiocordyceps unilateralis]|uniref:Uncharacterized protein n=1 Tax=Ophiocordyceps unilateralis TaxID=268505 RepID=A0A2A9P4W3_OPHUN|nr:hypothetical protein XA68_16434 [Ophiocordyceps unilateralis]
MSSSSSMRPQLFTRGLSGLSQSVDAHSPAEQRDDAKRNFLKTMRPLPTQHYWDVYFDRQSKDHKPDAGEYKAELERLGSQIESIQDFWRYNNNTPVDQIKMRESIYLFNWTFRVPKAAGPDFWTRVQVLAVGERLQSALDQGDQLCGVGLSVRFNSHLVTIWHRDSSKQKSIDGMLACVMDELPSELRPKPENYFYKRHRDHAGFKPPPAEQQQQQQQESVLVVPSPLEVHVQPPSAH